ncbi:MAG: hypothetical protein AAF517_19425, partial [Planctomycetota bacterium]
GTLRLKPQNNSYVHYEAHVSGHYGGRFALPHLVVDRYRVEFVQWDTEEERRYAAETIEVSEEDSPAVEFRVNLSSPNLTIQRRR